LHLQVAELRKILAPLLDGAHNFIRKISQQRPGGMGSHRHSNHNARRIEFAQRGHAARVVDPTAMPSSTRIISLPGSNCT